MNSNSKRWIYTIIILCVAVILSGYLVINQGKEKELRTEYEKSELDNIFEESIGKNSETNENTEIFEESQANEVVIVERFGENCFSIYSESIQPCIDNKIIDLPVEYGLEKNIKVSKEYHLDELPLEEEEQILFLNVYDFDVCDYIEQEVFICGENAKLFVCYMILDRRNNLLGYKSAPLLDYYGEVVSKNSSYFIENLHAGLRGWINVDFQPPVAVVDTYEELERMDYKGIIQHVYIVQEDEFIDGYEKELLLDESFIEETGERVWDENAKIEWSCAYLELKNIPFSVQINREVRKEIDQELQRCIDASSQYLGVRNSEELKEEHIRTMKISVYGECIYQDEQYLGVAIISTYRDVWDGVGEHMPQNYYIISFNLETGEKIKLEEYLGSDLKGEELEEIAWIGYQNLMKEAPEKYTKDAFYNYMNYYREDYDHGRFDLSNMRNCFYFNKKGIVFYYDYYILDIPVVYLIDKYLLKRTNLEVPVTYEELEEYKRKAK